MNRYNKEIQSACNALKNGGIIICPTDTIIGISANARNAKAVEKVIALKGRDDTKSFIVLVNSLTMLKQYVVMFPSFVQEFLDHQNTPTTIIYPNGKNLASNVMAKNGSVGIRIVKSGFANTLITAFGAPIISSSVNLSGHDSIVKTQDIPTEIKNNVDYIVLLNETSTTQASQIFIVKQKSLIRLR